MSLQPLATALLLPPILLTLCTLTGTLLAWRGRRWGIALAMAAAATELLLATPLVSGLLKISLEAELKAHHVTVQAPHAIIILGAEAAQSISGPDIGPLTLERLRAGAALQRQSGLPVLVTGGPLSPGDPPIAKLMAQSIEKDFGVTVRWVEPAARDTHENAVFSADLLRKSGIGEAYVVTHAWHLPRAIEAFEREGFSALPFPVRLDRAPDMRLSSWVPRADHLGESWFALREWAGRLIYAIRDRH